ncbi:FapA family protein [Petroclostridium sp. X23]|uniref:FapA family protein n=1 Tax=Petroclostridium sp. X23 TaxID=3045146 RepID=UPI0024AE7DEB|nr:FapA family protein [Petroclostridium sp. X23]WHH58963.1 FapA family protein [Petroclostridium sp. X23]
MSGGTDAVEKRGYRLNYREEGVFLVVYPFEECGKIVGVAELFDLVKRKNIDNYDSEKIIEAVEKDIGKEVKIAPPQEEYKIDAHIKIIISHHKMRASIIIEPPDGGEMLSSEQIINALENENIVFGIDHETVDTISRYPVYGQEIEVAHGSDPVNGENAKMQYHFKLSKNTVPKILDDGKVDFRQLDLIDNVHAGDVLITVIPPTAGTPGKNVYGEEIPPISGKPVILPKGKNVKITENGLKLIAAIDGQVIVADRKVNVYSLYEVNGNVDNSTGNINFIGNVVVKGNVLTGFSIEAGGTVEVRGVVEGAVIKAAGDIILHRGMQGLGKGVLITDGNIIAKYIEHSSLTAKGDIKSEAIMHSTVQCGGSLELAGKKGLIVGGATRVGKEVIAKVIGSPMATVTEIEVGLDPSLRERHKELKEEIASMELEIKKAGQAIDLLKKLESMNKLDESKKIILDKSIKTKLFLDNNISVLKDEYLKIIERIEEEGNGKIKVQNTVYPGTKVSIGSSVMFIKENMQYIVFYRDGADIRVGQYVK